MQISKYKTSLDAEIKAFEASAWHSTDTALILVHRLLLFFKENEGEFPILCQLAYASFLVMPSPVSIESVFSRTKLKVSLLRSSTLSVHVQNLTMIRRNGKR